MAPRRSKGTSLHHSAVTIRDIAREAHVALGTASRVLSGATNVRPETKERVMAVAERLGYRPNPMARALARGRTNTLGVLAPFFFTRQNYVDTVRGIQAGISDFDYSLVIYSIDRPEQVHGYLAPQQRHPLIDGLIFVALDAKLIEGSPLPDIPILCVDTHCEGLTSISPDHERGAFDSTSHLIEHGHRRLAFIDRPQDPVSQATSASRRDGFQRAHREAGLSDDAGLSVVADYTAEGGYAASRALLESDEPPTAFICASDLQAIGVMRAVRELNLRVGQDVAVVGYNDVGIAEYLGLTSVHVPSFEIGREAVAQLLTIVGGGERLLERRFLEPRLVTRTSCGCGE